MVLLAFSLQTIVATKYVYNQVHMGVNFTATLYAPSEVVARRAATSAFLRIKKLDEIMSDYLPESELSKMNSKAFRSEVRVSKDLYAVMSQSQKLSRETDGLFDITIKPLVQIWRAVRKSGKEPVPEEVAAARKLVGFKKLKLNSNRRTVRFLTDGMTIDLGGIGKGYACQEAVEEITRVGVKSAMVEGGGDLYCSKAPPNSRGWMITIEGSSLNMALADRAVSTSGSTTQFVEIAGKKYSHIIDPRTAMGVTSARQVTVVGKDGAKVDALATAFCIEPNLIGRFRDVRATVVVRK